jgi:hypothetical protein
MVPSRGLSKCEVGSPLMKKIHYSRFQGKKQHKMIGERDSNRILRFPLALRQLMMGDMETTPSATIRLDFSHNLYSWLLILHPGNQFNIILYFKNGVEIAKNITVVLKEMNSYLILQ